MKSLNHWEDSRRGFIPHITSRKLSRSSRAKLCEGFTFLELMLAVGILVVILAAGAPVGLNFYLDYQFDYEYELLFSLLQQSRNLAMVNYEESNHGLYIDNEDFVIFRGSSYAARVAAADRAYARAGSPITVSGAGELVFAALQGSTASTTLVVSDGRKSRDIYINPEGLVYEP